MNTITDSNDVDNTVENIKTDKTVLSAITPGTVRTISGATSLGQVFRDTLTMAWRHFIKMFRNPAEFTDVTIQPILFTLMFVFLFGGAIAGDVKSYLPTMIPGLLAMSVLTTASVTGTKMREDMDKGVFDRFKSLPMARIAPLSGALLADTLRYFIATTLTFATGFVIGYRPESGMRGVVVAGLLIIFTTWALSWIFALLGVIMPSASSVQGLSMMILMPLTFVSNAIVPVASMPSWLQAFVKVNPITHVVSAMRDLTMNGDWGVDVVWTLVISIIIVVVFAPLTVRAYMRKV
ncbi:MAG: ABC transporter permease [Propionibacteriaceae bacterium]|jgi:ABC-2 type transport system permease protein|nr:ABC transporter permease [Propionibacteriaceae bacterium]